MDTHTHTYLKVGTMVGDNHAEGELDSTVRYGTSEVAEALQQVPPQGSTHLDSLKIYLVST